METPHHACGNTRRDYQWTILDGRWYNHDSRVNGSADRQQFLLGNLRLGAGKVNTKTTTLALFIAAMLLVGTSTVHASAVDQDTTTIYVVRAGDTLSGIGARFGISYREIMRANNLSDTLIYPGQRLAIPTGSHPAATVGVSVSGAGGSYVVRPGDTLWGIAMQHGISVEALKQANGLVSSTIMAGQSLRIPPSGVFPDQSPAPATEIRTSCGPSYAVRRGDTLSGIAQKCSTTVAALKFANNLVSDGIRVGQVLSIPGGSPPAEQTEHTTWLPAIVGNLNPASPAVLQGRASP